MSCSRFTEHGSKDDKSDPLVIIVNRNGTFTVDSNILEHVLSKSWINFKSNKLRAKSSGFSNLFVMPKINFQIISVELLLKL